MQIVNLQRKRRVNFISPNRPPVKVISNSSTIEKLTELHLSICAVDQEASYKFGNKFRRSTFLGPHPRNKNHFLYKIYLDDISTKRLKTRTHVPHKGAFLSKFRIPSENKDYSPDQHCQECVCSSS